MKEGGVEEKGGEGRERTGLGEGRGQDWRKEDAAKQRAGRE